MGEWDEVIVSTLLERVSRCLHLDLAHRIERFGVPVNAVTAEQAERREPADRTPCADPNGA